MEEGQSKLIDVSQLRVGMFIQLDLGWMDHPFPLNNFKISSEAQIHTIATLGLRRVRYVPHRSDASVVQPPGAEATARIPPQALERRAEPDLRRQRLKQLEQQQRQLTVCEQGFADAARRYRRVLESVRQSPVQARQSGEDLVGGCIEQMLTNGESVIRLLSEGVGERSAQHPVNVMVLSLLLGQALGLERVQLVELGLAGLLHDVGKQELPDRLRQTEEYFSAAEYHVYQQHVAHGVAAAEAMGLPAAVAAAIAQHHEMVDGSGFPARLKGAEMQLCGKVLALVNRYDNFCNPGRHSGVLTPHEALSVLFTQMKARFDRTVLGAFIRMMGVYPPGSVVQLGDERFALVTSVNSMRPLRPRVIVHDPSIPREEALVLDLETTPELSIRRSLKPTQLPCEAMAYLSPRQRICYFFERAAMPDAIGDLA
ncbi:HD-GYP domain-containing protein [Xylophilus sp. ASV27]|uniref:HD-GYP domain-containing protein n=1 Tax=Xylophilus sp. ASV27 TaxID=2795129 RepID=UPI0018EB3823|nr:HD-GYP domain-containing protein [Xylophilus sp. ASV27]